MKRFLLMILLSLFILMVLLVGAMRLIVSIPSPGHRFSHEANLKMAVERLDSLKDTPKIVIIGGSGCGFGIMSGMIKEHFGMPVVNTGTNAGLGLHLEFSIFRQFINKGDYVLVIQEYQHSPEWLFGQMAALFITASVYPEGFSHFLPEQQFYLAKYVPLYLKYLIGYIGYKRSWENLDSPYDIHSLNEYGDVTNYANRPHHHIGTYEFEVGDCSRAMDELVEFRKYCDSVGASFIMLPPAIQDKSFDVSFASIHHLRDSLKRRNIPYICEPERYKLPDSLFFDSCFHLTEEGCRIRTGMLIEDMENVMAE